MSVLSRDLFVNISYYGNNYILRLCIICKDGEEKYSSSDYIIMENSFKFDRNDYCRVDISGDTEDDNIIYDHDYVGRIKIENMEGDYMLRSIDEVIIDELFLKFKEAVGLDTTTKCVSLLAGEKKESVIDLKNLESNINRYIENNREHYMKNFKPEEECYSAVFNKRIEDLNLTRKAADFIRKSFNKKKVLE